mmetsp:Transcript_63732/g.164052  ORF Transcript_63732/g.164052 Transcript_63732/m.164052 type:complete len:231 (-) Transcript_63732:552-1244(-)
MFLLWRLAHKKSAAAAATAPQPSFSHNHQERDDYQRCLKPLRHEAVEEPRWYPDVVQIDDEGATDFLRRIVHRTPRQLLLLQVRGAVLHVDRVLRGVHLAHRSPPAVAVLLVSHGEIEADRRLDKVPDPWRVQHEVPRLCEARHHLLIRHEGVHVALIEHELNPVQLAEGHTMVCDVPSLLAADLVVVVQHGRAVRRRTALVLAGQRILAGGSADEDLVEPRVILLVGDG